MEPSVTVRFAGLGRSWRPHLDLVWAEGAAYAIGFAHALACWAPLLRPGGGIGVSEICWRSADPPTEARAWGRQYNTTPR